MNASDRIGLFQSLLDTFLSRTKEKGYIVIEVAGDTDAYVQFTVHSGSVYGEVGSRQWHEPERPLPARAVEGLAGLGFTGGGPERNFRRDGLPRSAAALASLADDLFRVAYGLPDEFSPIVREMNLNDVTFPRAEPFTRDMIEAHLRDHGAHFLRDEDGDYRADLECEGHEEPVTIWFIAEGLGDTTYRVSSVAPHRPRFATRMEALEHCNAWNAANRTPSAFVVGDDDAWRLVVATEVDLDRGITRALFDAMTERMVCGTLGFWSGLAAALAPQPSITDDGDDG